MQQHPDIQKQGANARALGVNLFDNPYFKAEKMPAVTGEDIATWESKTVAWNLGWSMEDAIRSQRA